MENSALFQKGTNDPLFTTVGVSYGYLVVEGCDSAFVGHLAQGKLLLANGVERQFLTGDQAGTLEAEMVAAGLLADEAAMYKAVADFKVPGDYKPAHTFRVCGQCSVDFPSLPHGSVFDDEGDRVAKFTNLMAGFVSCHDVAKGDKVHVLDAVVVFQQMVAAGLPANNDDVKARYEALLEEARAKLEAEGRVGRASIVEISGRESMVVLEIPRKIIDVLFGGKPEGESDDDKPDKGKEGRRRR